ncbi:MAG TPA: nucleoside deaminase [Chloroflexota bacterium]|jgi:tRNA(Arg) A34 adenosine deaminase TadA|nr:nucleoside deaminase [Chloroflexota bacterium]
MNDLEAMRRCIELARLSVERGDHPFGALVTRGGELLAEGLNSVVTELDPTAHAETVAMRNACRAMGALDLSGATLYTSCEPCWICSCALRELRVERVVFALTSPKGGGYSSTRYPILTDAGIERYGPPPRVEFGLLAEESQALWTEVGWPRPRN